jgi:Protein kinase domain
MAAREAASLQQQQQKQQLHAGTNEQIGTMLPTQNTFENWKMIYNVFAEDDTNFQRFYDMARGVPFVEKSDLEQLALSIAKKDIIACYDAYLKLQKFLLKVSSRVTAMHYQLVHLSGLNQADTSSSKRSRIETSGRQEFMKDAEDRPRPLESGALSQIEDKRTLERFGIDCPLIGDFDGLEESHQISLQEFNGRLEKWFGRGNIFGNHTDEKEYRASLRTLESLLAGDSNARGRDHLVLIPGPLAAEVAFVQPYLLVVLQMLGSAVDKVEIVESPSSEKRSSPGKTTIQKNRIIPETKLRPARVADKSIAANSRYIFLLNDDSVEIPVEEKPGEREHTGPDDLLHEYTNQVLSHLAKQVGMAFNFRGIGIDGRATGVVLTTVYVKILQLRLENMGTPEMKLIQFETKCMPLQSKVSFEKWVKGRESKWKRMKTELYGDDAVSLENTASSTAAAAAVPSGLVALWNLMTASRSALVGRSPLPASGELGEMVGYGGFSTVHHSTKNDTYVIKLSRSGFENDLLQEAAVLTALMQQKEDKSVVGISQLVRSTEMPVTIGGIEIRLSALILEPRGISAEMHLARSNDKEEALRAIGKDSVAALDFIHSRGYTHNDVSPKNILFNELRQQAFLIDFGLATLNCSDTIRGFCGTDRYAHPAVLLKYERKEKWKAEPIYDKSSLAFSFADLSSNGKHLWDSLQPGRSPIEYVNSWAEKRASISWNCLQQAGFSNHHDWESWCFAGLDEEWRDLKMIVAGQD